MNSEKMHRITVMLTLDESKTLIALARRERRDPRQQAAVLIHHELERLGLLSSSVVVVGNSFAPEVSDD